MLTTTALPFDETPEALARRNLAYVMAALQ
jgi:hypothetical protein